MGFDWITWGLRFGGLQFLATRVLGLGKHSLDWGPALWMPTVSSYQFWLWETTGLGVCCWGAYTLEACSLQLVPILATTQGSRVMMLAPH